MRENDKQPPKTPLPEDPPTETPETRAGRQYISIFLSLLLSPLIPLGLFAADRRFPSLDLLTWLYRILLAYGPVLICIIVVRAFKGRSSDRLLTPLALWIVVLVLHLIHMAL